jgi:cation diffusion facilitator family transporter
MHTHPANSTTDADSLARWDHPHSFLGHDHQRNERRTQAVVVLTAVMMVAEIAAGIAFHSMALLADGWHMGTHVGALSITALAYTYARRHAENPAFAFGTGKFGDLAAFASAIVLALVSLLIGYESVTRLIRPEAIEYDAAIAVAVIGLGVNLVSALMLGGGSVHAEAGAGHHDHNLRSAYAHVLADALTSVFAIVALVAGRWLGWVWMDPAMGIVGAVVIARWSYGLIRASGRVLLDAVADPEVAAHIRHDVESGCEDRVADLHLWRVGPGHFAAVLTVVTHTPHSPDYYRALLEHHSALSHVTVEVQRCD